MSFLAEVGGWPGGTELALVSLAALLGSLLSALTGSGAGVVLSIALLPIVGVRSVVPVIAIAMVISHIGRVYAFRHDVNWRAGFSLVAVSLPGNVLGSLVYAGMPERLTAAVLGLFLLGLIGFRMARGGLSASLSTPGFLIAGFLFGLLHGLTLGAGILVLPLLMFFGLAGVALVATDAIVGLCMNLGKAVSLGMFDVITPSILVYGLAVGALSVPGAFLARALIARLSLKTHGALIDLTIAVAAASMLWRAVYP